MINIWELMNYDEKIKIRTKSGKNYVGKVCLIEDIDEDDDYESECLFLDCEDGTWAIFANEIEKIEKVKF